MISRIVESILNVFRYHKKKALAFIASFLLFGYLFFPFNDLGDLFAAKVSELTSGQIFLSFDNLDLSLFPQPGLSLRNVNVETPFTPELSAGSLSIAPSISGLLSLKPGVSLYAGGFMGGSVSLSTRGGDKTAQGKRKQDISLDVSDINLGDVSKFVPSNIKVAGAVSGSVSSVVDPDFFEQPTADIDLKGEGVQTEDMNITTDLGPISLPRMKLSDAALEGKLEKGTLQISKLIVGRPGSDLYAQVSGKVDMRFDKLGQNVAPRPGAYDLTVRLQVGEGLKQKMGAFLGILQTYQTAPNTYSIHLTAANMNGPPSMSRAQ